MVIPSGIQREREGSEAAPRKEFASREDFLGLFSGFITSLSTAEGNFDRLDTREFVERGRQELASLRGRLTPAEAELFEATFNLFSIKHKLPPFDQVPEACEFLLGKGLQDINVEVAGPLGVGKTTVAEPFAKDINGQMVIERFRSEENPFLDPSYKDPGLMLRTQLKFLLENIKTGLDGKYHQGREVRDTSVRSDIYVMMEWRKQRGKVTGEEYQAYMATVELLEPLISRPDLLAMLLPSTLERLREGLNLRIRDNPEVRQMEKAITDEDLEVVTGAAQEAVKKLEAMGIKVYEIPVDPVEVYTRKEVRYSIVYQLRERLGILKEYLTKDPEKVAKKVVGEILAPNRGSQVVYVHSQSMFAGKTSVLIHIAELVGGDNVLTFQPQAALRHGPEYVNKLKDRDGVEIPAVTINSNRLSEVIALVKKEIEEGRDPKCTYIFLDEVMLFHESNSEEALESIEKLRELGFHVVCDGIDYTFQEKPFNFAHDLIRRAVENDNWHEEEMGTRCRYCSNPARGTRRYNLEGKIARYNEPFVEAGEEQYEPVCCDEHNSCVGQPEGFVRQPLPTEIKNG